MNENIQDRDYQWFLTNYSELFNQYGMVYLAIKNETVLGTYSTYEEGVRSVSEIEELGTFIVQKCNGNESAYTNYISSMNLYGE